MSEDPEMKRSTPKKTKKKPAATKPAPKAKPNKMPVGKKRATRRVTRIGKVPDSSSAGVKTVSNSGPGANSAESPKKSLSATSWQKSILTRIYPSFIELASALIVALFMFLIRSQFAPSQAQAATDDKQQHATGGNEVVPEGGVSKAWDEVVSATWKKSVGRVLTAVVAGLAAVLLSGC